jgi:hypothetical protein
MTNSVLSMTCSFNYEQRITKICQTDKLVQFQGVQHEQDLEHDLLPTLKVQGLQSNIYSINFIMNKGPKD